MPVFDLTLYLVTDSTLCPRETLPSVVEAAIEGGVTLVQLREKECDSRTFYDIARRLQPVCARHRIPFIINDRLDIALAVDADGVHIGQQDLPCTVVRRLLGPNKILGVSASSPGEARAAADGGADYIGAGAVYPTATKAVEHTVDAAAIRAIRSACNLPVVAIGGLKATNLDVLDRSDADGISVVSAIVSAEDPKRAAAQLRDAFARVRR